MAGGVPEKETSGNDLIALICCDMFDGPRSAAEGSKWGTSENVIVFVDNMMSISITLNQEAKKLRASKKVEHVWTINGTIPL